MWPGNDAGLSVQLQEFFSQKMAVEGSVWSLSIVKSLNSSFEFKVKFFLFMHIALSSLAFIFLPKHINLTQSIVTYCHTLPKHAGLNPWEIWNVYFAYADTVILLGNVIDVMAK